MRQSTLLFLGLIVLLFSSSCATITRGSTDDVIVRTYPPGAEVTLSNGMVGISPANFEVPRKQSVVVSICKEGFKPVQVTLNPVISGEGGAGMAGNIIAGGLIGAAVDASSGAMYDLTPNPLEVTLIPLGSSQEYAPFDSYEEDIRYPEDYDDSYDAYDDAHYAAYDGQDPSQYQGFGEEGPGAPMPSVDPNAYGQPVDSYAQPMPNQDPYGQPNVHPNHMDVPVGPDPNDPNSSDPGANIDPMQNNPGQPVPVQPNLANPNGTNHTPARPTTSMMERLSRPATQTGNGGNR